MKIKTKLIYLWIMSVLVMIAPLTIVICVKADKYITKSNGVSLSIGCMIALVCFVIILLKKDKGAFRGYVGETIILVLAYCFNSILSDFLLVYFAIWLGDGLYRLLFKRKIDKYTRLLKVQQDSEIEMEAKEEGMNRLVDRLADKINNRGDV